MIGVFDSGIGGLTIVSAIRKKLGNVPIIYFGDTARTPYGNKSAETIKQYTREDINFLLEHKAKIIVAACHSASSLAHNVIHAKSNMPAFDVVDASVRAAMAATKTGRIGVIGTRATINSGIYQKLLQEASLGKNIKVFTKACPLFVPLVEENWINRPETKMIARAYLQELKVKKIDTLVLACTHYPFLRGVIASRMGKHVKLIDPGEEVAKDIESFLSKNMPELLVVSKEKGSSGISGINLHFSDTNPRQEELVHKWLAV